MENVANVNRYEMIMNNLKTVIDRNDEDLIRSYINLYISHIDSLKCSISEYKAKYIELKFLANLCLLFTSEKEKYQTLKSNIKDEIKNINFEKKILIQLKKNLIKCQSKSEYDNLFMNILGVSAIELLDKGNIIKLYLIYEIISQNNDISIEDLNNETNKLLEIVKVCVKKI